MASVSVSDSRPVSPLELIFGRHAQKTAVIEGNSGAAISYGELDRSSKALASAIASTVPYGGRVALLMTNTIDMMRVLWAAQRSGVYFTPIPTGLSPSEATFMINDCGATALFVDRKCADLSDDLLATTPGVVHRIAVRWSGRKHRTLTNFIAAYATDAASRELDGMPMLYSSGTSGRPKAIKRPLSERAAGTWRPLAAFDATPIRFDETSVYLGTGPLYHAAPLNFSMTVQRAGGTLVLMDKFEAETALMLMSRYEVTHIQFVPTMLRRLIELPVATRDSYFPRPLRYVVHAAAPCPEALKRRIIDWLGPIVYEYYGSTEGIGITFISSAEWLERPGSVGRSLTGPVHIVGDEGTDLPPGAQGIIYFDGSAYPSRACYAGAAGDGAELYDDRHWGTVRDIGWLDADGYLYITDRQSGVIISGGVNIYPREVENVLITHPAVGDAAVAGYPDADRGEVVWAAVTVVNSAVTEGDLMSYCRRFLARNKCPRRILFVTDVPRSETGKVRAADLRKIMQETATQDSENLADSP